MLVVLLLLHDTDSTNTSYGFYIQVLQSAPSYKTIELQTAHPYILESANFSYNQVDDFNCTINFSPKSEIRPSDYVQIVNSHDSRVYENKQWPDVINMTTISYLLIRLIVSSSNTSPPPYGLLMEINVTSDNDNINDDNKNDDNKNDDNNDQTSVNTVNTLKSNYWKYVNMIFTSGFFLLIGLIVLIHLFSRTEKVKHLRLIISGRNKKALKFVPAKLYTEFLSSLQKDPYVGISYQWIGNGFYEDLVRALANLHPLLACLFADKDNHFNSLDHAVIYYLSSCVSFAYFAISELISQATVSENSSIAFYIVFKILLFPFLIGSFEYLARILLTCPCLRNLDCSAHSSLVHISATSYAILLRVVYLLLGAFFIFFGALVKTLGTYLHADSLTYDPEVVVSFVFETYFIYGIIFVAFTDAMFISLKFVDTRKDNVIGRCLRIFDLMTCRIYHVGAWHRNAEIWNNKPRVFFQEDADNDDDVPNPLQIKPLQDRIYALSEESHGTVPGFPVEDKVAALDGALPGFIVDDSLDSDNHDCVRSTESSVVTSFPAMDNVSENSANCLHEADISNGDGNDDTIINISNHLGNDSITVNDDNNNVNSDHELMTPTNNNEELMN